MALVDLFSCNGGFSLGAHRAGLTVAAAYDLDPILTSSYSRNFPNTQIFIRDITELSGSRIREDVGSRISGIFGGPPCQGFSDIGRRDGQDPRRLLLVHFFRIVAELQPDFFIMENVRGLSQTRSRPLLDHGLSLVSKDYNILGPVLLDASDFGAATKRQRIFVVGVHRDRGDPVQLADFDHYRRSATTVRDAIGDLSDSAFIGCDDLGFDRWILGKGQSQSFYSSFMRSADRSTTGNRPVVHRAEIAERFSEVRQGGVDRIGRHPRLAWDGLCPTLRAGTGSDRGSYQAVRPLHPEFNRVITVREAARLQGFHDAHMFHPTNWHSFRMIGNSVCPIIAEALFAGIIPKTDCFFRYAPSVASDY
jgi:DNA (cytosine-5)-methyltransferase 1